MCSARRRFFDCWSPAESAGIRRSSSFRAQRRGKRRQEHILPLFCFLYFIARQEFHRRLNTFFAAAPNSPTECTKKESCNLHRTGIKTHTQRGVLCAFEKRVGRPPTESKIQPSLNLRVKEKSLRFCIQAAWCLRKEASWRRGALRVPSGVLNSLICPYNIQLPRICEACPRHNNIVAAALSLPLLTPHYYMLSVHYYKPELSPRVAAE
jgi:hypothetical protein